MAEYCIGEDFQFVDFIFFFLVTSLFLVAYIAGVYRNIVTNAKEESDVQRVLIDVSIEEDGEDEDEH